MKKSAYKLYAMKKGAYLHKKIVIYGRKTTIYYKRLWEK